MKGHLRIMIVFTIALIAVPFIALLSAGRGAAPASAGDSETAGETVLMLFGDDKAPTSLSMREYIIGAVAAQMPADFGEEALRAQAVLAHTYALRRRAEEKADPTPALKGADLSDDSTLYNAYFTEEQIRALSGTDTDEVMEKLAAAADYALTRTLTYKGEPVIAAFHAVSCGRTESALAAWGEDIPYLKSVDSSADLESKVCTSELTLTGDQLYAALSKAFPDAGIDRRNLTVKVTEKTEAGCAATVELCGMSYVSGTAFAEAAGLPSACFEVSEEEGSYKFITKGRGRLVGMSQYGARAMALEGKTCEDILTHYFPGTEIKVRG